MTVPQLLCWKKKGRKISAITAYCFTTARLVEQAGIDLVLVGDSLANVVQGLDTTLPVTVEEVIYHTRAVRRGLTRPLLVADMPFMSYQVSGEEALRNAGRLMKEGGAQAVKLEGGREHLETVRRLVQCGIPVMGHLGLTPQSIHQIGGYRVQGRTEQAAQRILEDARSLEEAGIFSLVLECVPAGLARQVTEALAVPTIGIGAGGHCDGQILVLQDVLGMNPEFQPRFVRRFAQLGEEIVRALTVYGNEVREGTFPGEEESFDPVPNGRAGH
ncbi:MAG: 3-methyl-2-oxobutanoate hydroxymethyltransferase [Bradymonadales bacterium]|nr:3-methyl-2-oxobutanoate hydroxymethyltransferase [Bradymonadales bacterium]